MICNYTNTIDLCCNKYSYSFINVIPSGTTVIADKSETAPVLRTDKSTLETKIISPSSNNLIPTCDINDNSEDTTDWECYIIYRYMCSGIISDPPLQTFKNVQIDLINSSYSATLEDGILVTINTKNIILGSSINDQISYKSILSYAQALYDDDTDASMPPFTDKNGQVYNLSYSDLIVVFKTYFEKVILYKNLKDTLINQCSNSSTIDNIQQLNWCSTKPLTGSLIGTKIVTTVDKPIVQSCIVVDTDTSGVDVSCDPPCDPESCEICVDGSCVSSCGQGECCVNGTCVDCSCDTNNDCGYCVGMIGPFDTGCAELVSLCSELQGTYSTYDIYCACNDIVLLVGTEANCTAANNQYNGSFTFEQGHCCDNTCQYESC